MARRQVRWWLVGTLYALSLAMLTVFAARRWVWGVAAAAALLAGTSIVVNRKLHRYPPTTPAQRFWRRTVPWLMAGAGLALALWPFGKPTDGQRFFGVCLLFLGMGQLLTLWRSSRSRSALWGVGVVVACAAAFVAGLAGISEGASVWAVGLIAVGILASPVGLSLLSEDGLERLETGTGGNRGLVLGLAGVVLAAAGLWLLVLVAGIEVGYVLILAGVLALLVGAIASDTPADVLIVVAVVALVWAIAPRSVAPDEAVLPEAGETVVVALGDSYMSGEGARQFYAGTNRKGENECRRAPTAYAPVVVARDNAAVPDDLAFLACSGARARHIHEQPQHAGEPIGGPVATGGGIPARGLDQLAHLDWLIRDKDVDVAVVIVSVGGNDARFGEIGRSCIGPGDCSELGGSWLENLARVAPSVDQAYQEIRDAVGDEVPVLVVPYPVPLNAEGCPRSLLTANEHRFLHGFVGELNTLLRRAAADAGLYYLDGMRTVLQDRRLRICDGPAGEVGVNFFGLNPVDGLVEQSVNPLNWFHNSLHPNQRGHEVMADTLQAWLDARPGVTARAEPAREQGVPRIATVEELMGDDGFRHCGSSGDRPAHCDGSVDDWTIAQVADVIRLAVGPLLLLIAGIWVLWLLAILWWRRRYR